MRRLISEATIVFGRGSPEQSYDNVVDDILHATADYDLSRQDVLDAVSYLRSVGYIEVSGNKISRNPQTVVEYLRLEEEISSLLQQREDKIESLFGQ